MSALLLAAAAALAILSVRSGTVDIGRYLGSRAAKRRRRIRVRPPLGALWGAGLGACLGLVASEARQMVSLAILGALGGALAVRSVGSTRRQSRSRRLAEELPTVTDTLALHVLAGASVTGAITAFTDACRGVAAEELTKAITSNDGLEFGLRSASEETAYPDAARLYDLLGHAHRTGGRLADSLLDLSAEYRASRADELTAEGGRRALAAYGPILAFMIPVTFLFLMYPTLAGLNALSSAP
jgi:tight adherence protein C